MSRWRLALRLVVYICVKSITLSCLYLLNLFSVVSTKTTWSWFELIPAGLTECHIPVCLKRGADWRADCEGKCEDKMPTWHNQGFLLISVSVRPWRLCLCEWRDNPCFFYFKEVETKWTLPLAFYFTWLCFITGNKLPGKHLCLIKCHRVSATSLNANVLWSQKIQTKRLSPEC